MRVLTVLWLLCVVLVAVAAERDYYEVLGVARDASDREIKQAYRELTKKYHPDKNPGDETAQARFIEIGEAYAVLTDDEQRAVYDRYGHEGVKQGGQQQQQQQHDPFDMFANFFGGGQQRRGRPRGADSSTELEFTLKEFFNGLNTDFSLQMQDICDKCSGSGSRDGKTHTCSQCSGRGRVVVKRQIGPGMFQRYESVCPQCQGSGNQITHHCKKCHGQKVVRGDRKYNFHLQPGMPRNHVEIYAGESEKSPEWDAGDLRVKISESKTGNLGYRRVGKHLYRTEVLTLKEALNGGWERAIPFLDNYDNTVVLKRAPGQVVAPNEVERVKGRGMPVYGGVDEYGDLFIEYKVVIPHSSKYKDEL
ncbi:hypothetical protein OGAPHI_000771 [Ogataea philodendri]|uniref:Uncharacterized protein n=1 Tax=Ogataea philodendri TaxID=1378263 RepID=A0A9P8TA73_9ASCO|nr:uncharacterized protein OGAPHI_000771 [Ogataea philodendri]KAH3671060.1 hypothetical protein OGAPHI_000771 [Ogataea philodendri]